MNVLLVEDEPRVADFIDRGLRAENLSVILRFELPLQGNPDRFRSV